MKNSLSTAVVQAMADSLLAVYPDFKREQFVALASDGLASLELKQRVQHIINALVQNLPQDFAHSGKLLTALPDYWDALPEAERMSGFAVWPLIDYVAVAGLEQPQLAYTVLAALTPRFSAEFAIRPFIERYPEQSWQQLLVWSQAEDEHLRRLASEGCRPRLPWGKQLKDLIADPRPILPILDALKDDTSLYVRRSVANNLNDISKDHPEWVLDVCQAWLENATKQRHWLIKHATRSLIKQGHPRSFTLLGYTAEPALVVEEFALLEPQVKQGQALTFGFALRATQPQQNWVVDYAVHFMKANGQKAAKVFKLKNIALRKDECFAMEKSHSFKPISTRNYYAGEHSVALHVNGQEVARRTFYLED
ncbi:DNA alkylation repair protein [Agarivorans sp.]|uniref:DNA alkylation repair protein n=1 Tax=Agarivorans sp. TaxID=1872412 RepID=UPI003CFF0EB0